MKISLGPLQYYWTRDAVLAFYDAVAGAPVDIVYLGETVCARRHELRLADWLAIAERLEQAGKQAVLSTQVLIEAGSDLSMLHRIAGNGRYLVEANDMGAVQAMQGRPFVAGPHLNIYSPPTLSLFAKLGAGRWIMPFEMGRDALAALHQARPPGLETEVFAYGRMPLAFSARCFTARKHNLPKHDCKFSCIDYPDGLLMETREKQAFLVLNGIQPQSARVYNLVHELAAMRALGVDVVRISPQSHGTVEVAGLMRAVLDGRMPAAEAHAAMLPLMPAEPCNGFWHGKPGLDQIAA